MFPVGCTRHHPHHPAEVLPGELCFSPRVSVLTNLYDMMPLIKILIALLLSRGCTTCVCRVRVPGDNPGSAYPMRTQQVHENNPYKRPAQDGSFLNALALGYPIRIRPLITGFHCNDHVLFCRYAKHQNRLILSKTIAYGINLNLARSGYFDPDELYSENETV